jgi:hypothetical protein
MVRRFENLLELARVRSHSTPEEARLLARRGPTF